MRHPGRRPRHGRGGPRRLAAVLASALLLTGCAQSVDPIERLGKKAAQSVRSSTPRADQAYRHWGLTDPLAAPPRHAARQLTAHTGDTAQTRVVDRVDTTDKVVFLTYEDGTERDPRFADMVRELRLPVTLFLTGSATDPAYDHASRLRSAGAGVENRTLDGTPLRGLPYARQHAEICGAQERLKSRFGHRPRLLRPPHGAYDRTTLRAAARCGVPTLVLWRAAMTSDGLSYARGDAHLHPGDIVLVTPDETAAHTLRDHTTRLLRRVQERGLTVGHLEDYL